MQSLADDNMVQVSSTFAEAVDDLFVLEERGEFDVKDFGRMTTFTLHTVQSPDLNIVTSQYLNK